MVLRGFGSAAAVLAVPPAIMTGSLTPQGFAALFGGLLLHQEAGKGDSFVTAGRESHYLTHVGANVRPPRRVGVVVGMVDAYYRTGQSELLRIPVDVRKALVREALSVVLSQETSQLGRLPAPDVCAYSCAARARPKEGGAESSEC